MVMILILALILVLSLSMRRNGILPSINFPNNTARSDEYPADQMPICISTIAKRSRLDG